MPRDVDEDYTLWRIETVRYAAPFREVIMTTLRMHRFDRPTPMWPGTWRWLPAAVALLVLAILLAILEYLLVAPQTVAA